MDVIANNNRPWGEMMMSAPTEGEGDPGKNNRCRANNRHVSDPLNLLHLVDSETAASNIAVSRWAEWSRAYSCLQLA